MHELQDLCQMLADATNVLCVGCYATLTTNQAVYLKEKKLFVTTVDKRVTIMFRGFVIKHEFSLILWAKTE